MKFEYKIVNICDHKIYGSHGLFDNLESTMNEYAEQGWEYMHNLDKYTLVFRREKQEEQKPKCDNCGSTKLLKHPAFRNNKLYCEDCYAFQDEVISET